MLHFLNLVHEVVLSSCASLCKKLVSNYICNRARTKEKVDRVHFRHSFSNSYRNVLLLLIGKNKFVIFFKCTNLFIWPSRAVSLAVIFQNGIFRTAFFANILFSTEVSTASAFAARCARVPLHSWCRFGSLLVKLLTLSISCVSGEPLQFPTFLLRWLLLCSTELQGDCNTSLPSIFDVSSFQISASRYFTDLHQCEAFHHLSWLRHSL